MDKVLLGMLSGELPEGMDYGNLDEDVLKRFYERINEKMKKRSILSKYQIKQLPNNGKWYVKINGRLYQRVRKEDLEDLVVKLAQANGCTLGALYEGYLACRKVDVEATTWKKDIKYYRTFVCGSPIENVPLSSLGIDHAYGFLEHCLKVKPDLKNKYWRNIHSFMNQMFQFAIDRGYLAANPFKNFRPKSSMFTPASFTRECDTVFSKDEQQLVCTSAYDEAFEKNSNIPLGILILFNLGLRVGELCALKWQDIETSHKGTYVHVQREVVNNITDDGRNDGFTVLEQTKTPAGNRKLLLNSKAVRIFGEIMDINTSRHYPTGMHDFIFIREYKGVLTFCTSRCFDHKLRQYCRKNNMEVIKSPHDIRRTVLTNLYMNGMPLKKIQEYAGHSSLKQTMEYIRVANDGDDIQNYLEML